MTRTPSRVLLRVSLALSLSLMLLPTVRTAAQRAADPAVAPKTSPSGKKVLTLADYGSWKRIGATALSDDGKWVTYTSRPTTATRRCSSSSSTATRCYTINDRRRRRRGGAVADAAAVAAAAPCSSPTTAAGSRYFVNPPTAAGRGRGGAAGAAARGRGAARGGGAGRRAERRGGGGAPAPDREPSVRAARSHHRHEVQRAQRQRLPVLEGIRVARDQDERHARRHVASRHRPARCGGSRPARRRTSATSTSTTSTTRARCSPTRSTPPTAWATACTSRTLGDRRDARARQRRDGLRRARRGATDATQPGGAARREAEGQGPEGQRAPRVDGRGGAAGRKTEWDPAKDAAFPEGLRAERVHGAALEQGRLARLRRHQGAGGHAGRIDRGEGQPRHLPLEGRRAAVRADRSASRRRGARRSRRRSRRVEEVRAARRRHDPDGHARRPTTRWPSARDATPYDHDFSEGQPSRADYYAIDTATGARTLIAKRLLRTIGTSPDSQWFLYLENQHVMANNLVTGKIVNVDARDRQELHQHRRRPWRRRSRSGAWPAGRRTASRCCSTTSTTCGAAARRRQGHDADRRAPAHGSAGPLRLTRLGAGGGGRRVAAAEAVAAARDEGIDLSKPQTLTAYGDWTKKSGYWTRAGRRRPARRRSSGPTRASAAR